jgi:hypothetical protein
MILDKDFMKYELKGPSGIRFFFANEEHLRIAVTEGNHAYVRVASYVIDVDGKFLKSRTVDPSILNAILMYDRREVLEFIDFVEGK